MDTWVIVVIGVVIIGGMMAMNFFRNKKQGQLQEEARQKLVPGAMIMTIGGIICKLIEINDKDDTLLVEMIPSGVQFTIIKNALYNIKKSPESDNAIDETSINYDDETEPDAKEKSLGFDD